MTIRVVVAFMCGFIVVIAYVAYLYFPVCCRTYTYRGNSGAELIRDPVGKDWFEQSVHNCICIKLSHRWISLTS